jgi:16S rRNA C967 or C1407 C5-methylase (RsmB/RsmF family)
MEKIQLEGIKFISGMVKNTIRIYPYQNLTESFFVAKIRRLS